MKATLLRLFALASLSGFAVFNIGAQELAPQLQLNHAEDSRAILPDAALDLFYQAIKLKSSAETEAQAVELFERAARAFEIQAESDYRWWYEAGTARWWANQSAIAILDYRRFLQHDQFRNEVWENLSQARLIAGTTEPGGEGIAGWPWALWLLVGSTVLASLSTLSLSLRLLLRKSGFVRLAIICGSLAVLMGLATVITAATKPQIAVLLVETQGRKGDGEVYAAQPATPLKAGQEAWLTETRKGWARIEINGSPSWVPLTSIEVPKK